MARILTIALAAVLLATVDTSFARIGVEYQMQLGNPTDAKADTNNHQHYLIQRSVFAEDYDDAVQTSGASVTNRATGSGGESIRVLKFRADMEDAVAQMYLGMSYEEGLGVPTNDVEAVKWYRKAAQHGQNNAQEKLGAFYLQGKIVSKNYAEAAQWYLKAAKQGNFLAQLSLGDLYMKGEGVPIDFVESAKWYRRAANQGVAQAQHNLAGMYFTGFAIKKNYVEAYKWYSLAAAHGQTESKAMIDQVMCLMTKDQISEGGLSVIFVCEAGSWFTQYAVPTDNTAKRLG